MSVGMIGLNAAKVLKQAVVTKFKKITEVAFSSKYLFYTNIGISCTLSGVGDVLEQHYEILNGNLTKWDKERTRKMAISGITVGIVCHHYYAFLDKTLPGRTFKILVKKVLIDQFICSPLCIATFFLTVAYLEDTPWQEFIENTKCKAWRLYTAEWIVWPPAQKWSQMKYFLKLLSQNAAEPTKEDLINNIKECISALIDILKSEDSQDPLIHQQH